MTCKDCLHYEACDNILLPFELDETCSKFTYKYEWVHLPVNIGDQVYVVYADEIQHTSIYRMKLESEYDHFTYIVECMIACGGARFEDFIFGQTAFLTREEAKKAMIVMNVEKK